MGFVKPHLPFAAPSRYWDLYDRGDLQPTLQNPTRPEGTTEIPFIYSELESYRGIASDDELTEEQVLELIHGYFAAVSFVDAQVGKLLDELDRLDIRDNTIVALVGDHGFHLGEQGIWAKHSLFELSSRTPLDRQRSRSGDRQRLHGGACGIDRHLSKSGGTGRARSAAAL